MTPERRKELIAVIAKVYPDTARIIASNPHSPMFDIESTFKRKGKLSKTALMEANRVAMLERRRRRALEGKCRDCDEPSAEGSKSFCIEHLERQRKYARKNYLNHKGNK